MNAPDPAFAEAVRIALSSSPKTISPKWLYDSLGSALFVAITRLPEYGLTRREMALLDAHATSIGAFAGDRRFVVEYGAGDGTKAVRLLSMLSRPTGYRCVEIEPGAASATVRAVRAGFPELEAGMVVADFTALRADPDLATARPLGFFPGSTLGNFDPPQAVRLLEGFRRHLGPDARLVIGADLVKPVASMVAAYDDALGVTAAFNKNVLVRINRELAGDFDLAAFRHEARWNAEESCIEMHLVAQGAQTVRAAGIEARFEDGESLHTESSAKFTMDALDALLARGGWSRRAAWGGPASGFAILGAVAV